MMVSGPIYRGHIILLSMTACRIRGDSSPHGHRFEHRSGRDIASHRREGTWCELGQHLRSSKDKVEGFGEGEVVKE